MERNIYKIGKELFITSDEEIKEGDWRYDIELNRIQKGKETGIFKNWKKIILTTDLDLIKDGIQAINDSFLEWFVNNPSCEWVEIDKGYRGIDLLNYKKILVNYKIIIPKEESKQDFNPIQGEEVWIKVFSNWSKGTYIGYDITKKIHLVREDEEGGGHLFSSSEILPYNPMANNLKQENFYEDLLKYFETTPREKVLEDWNKSAHLDNVGPTVDDFLDNTNKQQESLEEAAERYFPFAEKIGGEIYASYKSFIAGAKWQAKRSYSEDIINILDNVRYWETCPDEYKNSIESFLQQFKKK